MDVGPADGLGTLTLSGDSSQPWGLDQWFGTVINYYDRFQRQGHRERRKAIHTQLSFT